MKYAKLIAATLAVTLSGPVLAQTAAPANVPKAENAQPKGARHMERFFPHMSAEGRQIMMEAFRNPQSRENRVKVRAARDQVQAQLAADKLDVNALRRAMEAERQLVDTQQREWQERMITAFQKLSAADRKAFAADAHAGRERMERRMENMRKHQRDMREPAR